MQRLMSKYGAVVLTAMITLFGWTALANAGNALLSWNPNTEADLAGYKIYYGPSPGSYGAPIDVGNQTSYTITGLGTQTYYFAVTAYNTAGGESDFSNEVLKSFADTTPPVLSGITAANITSSSAVLSWTSNETATTQVDYGITTAYGASSSLNSTLTTSHGQTLTNLSPSTIYHYRVRSRDAAGNVGISGDNTFTTAAAPDTTPPAISGISTTNVSTTGATISWTTNETSDTQIQYGVTIGYGSATVQNTALTPSHSQSITGLTPSTIYHFRVLSRDAAGNLATSGDNTFTTTALPDTTAPVVSGIVASNMTATSAVITWSTNEAASSQVNYGTTSTYGSASPVDTTLVTSHSRTLTNLIASTTYHYRVVSKDAAGNSTNSADKTFTTSGTPDTTPPLISGSAAGNITATGATISWNTDEAATSQVEYGPTSSYGSLSPLNTTLLTNHSQALTNLNSATTYHYRILSKDGVGNTSVSGDGTFTTQQISSQPPDTTGPALSAIDTRDMTPVSVIITWGSDEPATSEVEFGPTSAYGNSSGMNATLLNSHAQTLTTLQSGTLYHYRVKSADAAGNLTVSEDHTLTTPSVTDTVPPADIQNFTAVGSTGQITLNWTNPPDADFVGVRILFRTDHFPTDLNDGEVLGDFSGSPNTTMSVIQAGLQNNITYYYSASSYDGQGNYQHTAQTSATPLGLSQQRGVTAGQSTSEGSGGGCAMIVPTSGQTAGPGGSADFIAILVAIVFGILRKGLKTSSKQYRSNH
ncbi:MAG: fibronectin type III domain-containing protein [Nitrospirae bacterium]|nr:fibronectin type III domain-containing protein [Candidatus Manganitrophaceae bacterium]